MIVRQRDRATQVEADYYVVDTYEVGGEECYVLAPVNRGRPLDSTLRCGPAADYTEVTDA